ncbi:MAG: hypothetical protein AAFX99_34930, partial [Myxococcota bacterium]
QMCPIGQEGCACQLDRSCDEGLVCSDDRCINLPCPEGSEGCACAQNLACDADLVCNNDAICEAEDSCTPGSIGCACTSEGSCNGADVVCSDNLCQQVDCPAGEEGCSCGPQGTCSVDANGEALSCIDGLCQSPTCAPGSSGCVCREGMVCDDEALSCIDGLCQPPSCVPGSIGCVCREGMVCDDNGSSCVEGNCVADPTPDTPVCYTPCTGAGFERDNGQFVACPADGLLEGCFGDTTCIEGQCLAEGVSPQLCDDSTDCPDFQDCLAGQCSSNCAVDSDCVDGNVCERRVCRRPCTVSGEESCGSGSFCDLADSESGVCRENVPVTEGALPIEPVDTFTLSTDSINLSSALGSDLVVVTNNSLSEVEFTVTRRSHQLQEENGGDTELLLTEGCQAPNCPLWWLEVSVGDGPAQQESVQTFTLEGGEETAIIIDNGQGIDRPRWQGILEVSTANGGTKSVAVSHSRNPAGQWSGEVYYFGSFKDVGLDAWMANRDNVGQVEEVENAFVRLWANFRQNRLDADQFQAGLVSTRTESWRNPRIYEMGCEPNSICFPYDNFDGYLTYTSDSINV